ncbi:hypothetical protein UNSW2_1023 [Campylobacter concisus UNSW2]|uniref:Uncharacterized protein n=1 Tax=Campylobacter concisus UNSW2 TaxID=1242965 RepID=U2F3I5_9BACT|nr:hypothetical protein UNSW2_1023 [Campylobacter concisus UNSW2]
MSIKIKFEKFVMKDKFKKSALKRSLFTPVHRCCIAVPELLH